MISKEYSSSKVQKRITDYACEDIEKGQKERVTLLDNVDKYWEYYFGIKAPVNMPWPNAASFFVPITGTVINAMHSVLMGSTFNLAPNFIVQGREKDDLEKATKVEQFFDYMITMQMDFQNVCDVWYLNGLVEGTGVLKQTWEKVLGKPQRTFLYQDPITFENVFEEKDTIERNAPRLTNISLRNYLVPSRSRLDIKPRFEAQRLYLTWQELEDRAVKGIYQNIDKIKNIADKKNYHETRLEYTSDVNDQSETDYIKRLYEVWEYWGDFEGNDCLFAVETTTRTLLRAQRNPYEHGERPFIIWRPINNPSSFYGVSWVKLMMPMQDQINDIHNSRINNMKLCSDKIFKQRRGSSFDTTKQRIYPGATLKLQNMDDVQVFEMGDIKMSTVNEEEMARAYIERLTAVNDVTLGRGAGQGKGGKTATGMLALIQQGNMKFDVMVKRLTEAMRKLANQSIQLCQQFLPNEIQYQKRVLGKTSNIAFETMSKDDIKGKFDFIPQISTASVNKYVDQDNQMKIYQIMLANPLCSSNVTRLYNNTRDLLIVHGKKNFEDYIGKQEDVEMLDKAGVPFPGMQGGMPPQLPPMKQGGGGGGTADVGGTSKPSPAMLQKGKV